MFRSTILLLICILISPYSGFSQLKYTNVSQPWTYWWWMGSSVTRQGITQNLEDMHTAGIGGVHIIPIYGEKGDEHNFIKYLSHEWMEMLKHTTSEANR
ncbi:MAG: glycosyl hydrolase, partial [Ignavibacteria bacterium]|nr:glycosyl hydrolase [Ignavibacteria bacterium]